MKFLLYIFCTYYLLLFDVTESVKLDFIKKFPIYENEEYILKFNTKSEKIQLYTIIYLKCYKNEKLVESVILNPGYLKGLPKQIYGEYFSALRYSVKPFLIELVLKFKRLSNEADLKIMYMETGSESARNDAIIDENTQKKITIANVRISLHLHWILNFVQKTLDHREGGLLEGSVGLLTCNASEGYPYSPATMFGVDSLDEVTSLSFRATEQRNEAQFAFMPTIKDHMKRVMCKAGNDEKENIITIFHHPTYVEIVPAIKEYMKNDSAILCKASNGFPTPTSKWKFLKGPKNPELFYSLKDNESILYINKNAPKGSAWAFQCIATNHIPNSLDGGMSETVHFIIGEKPLPIVLIITLVTSVSIILIILTAVVLCCRSGKCSHDRKKSLMDSCNDRGILLSQNSIDKKPITASLDNSLISVKNSCNSSFHSKDLSSKENNPVDLV